MGDLDFDVRIKTNHFEPAALMNAVGQAMAHGTFRVPVRLPADRPLQLVVVTRTGEVAIKGTAEVLGYEGPGTWLRFLSASDEGSAEANLVLHDVEVELNPGRAAGARPSAAIALVPPLDPAAPAPAASRRTSLPTRSTRTMPAVTRVVSVPPKARATSNHDALSGARTEGALSPTPLAASADPRGTTTPVAPAASLTEAAQLPFVDPGAPHDALDPRDAAREPLASLQPSRTSAGELRRGPPHRPPVPTRLSDGSRPPMPADRAAPPAMVAPTGPATAAPHRPPVIAVMAPSAHAAPGANAAPGMDAAHAAPGAPPPTATPAASPEPALSSVVAWWSQPPPASPHASAPPAPPEPPAPPALAAERFASPPAPDPGLYGAHRAIGSTAAAGPAPQAGPTRAAERPGSGPSTSAPLAAGGAAERQGTAPPDPPRDLASLRDSAAALSYTPREGVAHRALSQPPTAAELRLGRRVIGAAVGIAAAGVTVAVGAVWWALATRAGTAAPGVASCAPVLAAASPALTPAAASAAVTPAPLAPGAPRAASAAADPGHVADAGCRLRVTSNASLAEVWIDGARNGSVAELLEVPCRPLKVALRHPRYTDDLREVTPAAGVTEVSMRLVRPLVTMKIVSTPPGATVRVNGRELGKTPLQTKVHAFERGTIILSHDGGAIKTMQIYPQGDNTVVSATLPKPKPRPKKARK